MAIEAVALTTFVLNARDEAQKRIASTSCRECVLGRDASVDGLILPSAVRERVEAFVANSELDRLSELPENWDGYGAVSIDEGTIRNTRTALMSLLRAAPAPEIAPNSNGTISLEWESERGAAHLEIGKTRFGFYMKPVDEDASVVEGDPRSSLDGLGAVISTVLFPPVTSAVAITTLSYTAGNERRGY